MKVLVAYASKHDATKGIAERIATRLAAKGGQVDARSVTEIRDPESYQAFVIGSAVYFGGWMKEANDFVVKTERVLREHPVWLFSSGPLGDAPTVEPKEIAGFRASIGPRDHRVFYGALDRTHLSMGERMVAGAVKAPDGDFRDWKEIDAWADAIASEIGRFVPVAV